MPRSMPSHPVLPSCVRSCFRTTLLLAGCCWMLTWCTTPAQACTRDCSCYDYKMYIAHQSHACRPLSRACRILRLVSCLFDLLQYGDASVKKSDGDRDTSIHDRQAPVRRTEVVMFLLNVVNTSAALLLPCCVIHWTQVSVYAVLAVLHQLLYGCIHVMRHWVPGKPHCQIECLWTVVHRHLGSQGLISTVPLAH